VKTVLGTCRILAVGAALIVLAACAGAPQLRATEKLSAPLDPVTEDPRPRLPVEVTSSGGTKVTIRDVSRLVPLAGSLTETVFALGLGDNVVGCDITATFDEAAHLPLVTRAHDVSAESVLALRPTLVLAQTDTGPAEALDQIRRAGVPVVVFDVPDSINDVYSRVRAIARSLGLPTEGELLVRRIRSEIASVARRIPDMRSRPKVAFLYMRGHAGVYLIGGKGSGADSMIAAAGAVDAGTAAGLRQAFTPITSEALVKAAPDVILMTTTGLESVGGLDGVVDVPGVAQTPAGRDRRVISIEDGLLYSFGARSPVALSQLVDALYYSEGTSP
jgi:iron complex transport system substrate-binding protein